MGDINGLTDEGPKLVGPLLLVTAVLVLILLTLGLFMPGASWEF